jgi:hypothetical protein
MGPWAVKVVVIHTPALPGENKYHFWGSLQEQHQAHGCHSAWNPGTIYWLWVLAAKLDWEHLAQDQGIIWYLPASFLPQDDELLGRIWNNWDLQVEHWVS